MQVYDVIIIGGGPAGLSAALILGRSRRSVLLCDSGRPRNYASRGLHGFNIGRHQLQPYGVEFRHMAAASTSPSKTAAASRPAAFSSLPASSNSTAPASALARAHPVRQAPILRFEGHDGVLHRIVFAGGHSLDRRGVFLSTGQRQHSGPPHPIHTDLTKSAIPNHL